MRRHSFVIGLSPLVLPLLLAPACGDDGGKEPVPEVQPEPEIGATSFVSAGLPAGTLSKGGADGGLEGAPSEDTGGPDATVEEGDIFRLLGGGILLNLNAWRGLQVIDLSDLEDPKVVGSLRIDGQPVEMYTLGTDRAVVLMNRWHGYYGGAGEGPAFLSTQGGVVLLVDVSDPAKPAILDHAVSGGDFLKSRLVQKAGHAAVYTAGTVWQSYEGPVAGGPDGVVGAEPAPGGVSVSTMNTVVSSWEVVGSALEPRSELDLGGWVSDIQATTEAMMVARYDYTAGGGSTVTVVDLSDASGEMEAGADIEVAGVVENQFNMDLRGSVLRVVSQGGWGSPEVTNHIQTFDVSDPEAPVALDHETFGAGEQLFATLFLEDRAFFVTYFVKDPFHAFEITPEGDAIEHTAFVVSGWNDFFEPTLGDTRLVGVGVDDEDGPRNLAVSLYDTTDLDAAEPLVDREEVELDGAWSEASWDHRAFTVLEDAVDVVSPEGTPETGLVLLPFSGWNEDGYLSGVRIFTFSPATLTARGVMDHDSPVRRSFVPEDDAVANLSETTLRTFDAADPDAPALLGDLLLAPSWADVLPVAGLLARVESPTDYGWYWDASCDETTWSVQLLPGDSDPDTAVPLGQLPLAPGGTIWAVGDTLVTGAVVWSASMDGDAWTTRFETWDVSDPAKPMMIGSLEVEDFVASKGGWGVPESDVGWSGCWGFGWGGALQGEIAGETLVFVEESGEWVEEGQRHVCTTWPGVSGGGGSSGGGSVPPSEGKPAEPVDAGTEDEPGKGDGDDPTAGDGDEIRYAGGITCVTEPGGAEYCQGEIWECTDAGCEPVEPDEIDTTTDCWYESAGRWWPRHTTRIVDVSDAAAPALLDPIETPEDEEAVGHVLDGSTLWISTRAPFEVEGDDRPYYKYYARRFDLSDPAAAVSPGADVPGVNVPGALVAAVGSTLYARDLLYGEGMVESALSRVTVSGGVATLEAYALFDDRVVDTMLLDGAGHALVSHGPAWAATGWGGWYGAAGPVLLTVLDDESLVGLSTLEIDLWATLRAAIPGRALFQVPGGLLLLDLEDPAAPAPQAFFATLGWPSAIRIHEGRILVPAGRYGIYAFDLEASNLLEGE